MILGTVRFWEKLAAAADGEGGFEPGAADGDPVASERATRVSFETGTNESGRVAEAFANVVAPGASAGTRVSRFLDIRGLAQLALCACGELTLE